MVNKSIKIIGTILMSLLLLFIFNTYCDAASFSASISKTTVTVGDTFTVTVKANNAAGMYKVSTSNSNVTVSSGSTSEFLENSSATIKFKATKAGTVTITAKATDMTDLDDDTKAVTGTKTFKVTVKAKTSTNNNTSTGNNNSNTTTTTKPTFTSVNETVYAKSTVNVRSTWSTSGSVLGTLEEGDSVKRTGKGSNGWDKVTYNGKTAYIKSSYLTTTKPVTETEEPDEKEEEKSKDATLKSLSIKEGTLSPAFDKKTTEYTVSVPYETTAVEVLAEATDSKAKCTISKNTSDLKVGENKITITVTAEDETTKKYTILVTREKREALFLKEIIATYIDEQGNTKSLLMTPEFSQSILEYKLEGVSHSINSIDIKATANLEGAEIRIIGNQELKTGENTITITVTMPAQDEEIEAEVITYTLTINKQEEPVVVPPTMMGRIQNWFNDTTGGIMGWLGEDSTRASAIAFIICSAVIFILAICMIADYKKYKTALIKIAELTAINAQATATEQNTNTQETVETNTSEEISTETVRAKGKRFR